MMKELETAMNAMTAVVPMTNLMEETEFVPFFCMVAEEWCLAHDRSITEFMPMIGELITMVSTELGSYIY